MLHPFPVVQTKKPAASRTRCRLRQSNHDAPKCKSHWNSTLGHQLLQHPAERAVPAFAASYPDCARGFEAEGGVKFRAKGDPADRHHPKTPSPPTRLSRLMPLPSLPPRMTNKPTSPASPSACTGAALSGAIFAMSSSRLISPEDHRSCAARRPRCSDAKNMALSAFKYY